MGKKGNDKSSQGNRNEKKGQEVMFAIESLLKVGRRKEGKGREGKVARRESKVKRREGKCV